ncbi:MAG TPA: HupE/UreJ family protein [Opitutaceae bacterium]
MKTRRILGFAAFCSLFLVAAQAHPGHDGHELTWDFSGGALHPLSGWDHLLAMVSVGVWAAMLGGKARWLIPSAFVVTMTTAAFAATQSGAHAIAPGVIEQGIAASILGLGLLMTLRVRMPLAAAAALVAVFAAFHGWAHGLELPMNSNGFAYGLGFVASTIALHVVGVALGFAVRNYPKVAQATGFAVAAIGLAAAIS